MPGLVARQKELEKTLNHDVIGFTTAVAEKINDNASRWFHFGLTSSDIVDTAFAVQMVQSADILIADVKKVRVSIAKQARKNTSSRPASAAATASTPSRRRSASSSR